MSAIEGLVRSISAGPQNIIIRGACGGCARDSGVHLAVYESAPWEREPAQPGRQPAASARLGGGGAGEFFFLLDRFRGGQDRVYSRFVVRASREGSGRADLLPGVCYADELRDFAWYDYDYPSANTIKGLQVQMVDDAIALGIGHAALNLNLPTIMRPPGTDRTIHHRMDGRDYYFDQEYVRRFDRRVKELSDHGIVVNLILLNSVRWDGVEIHPQMREVLLHPDYDPEGRISAFNALTQEGLDHYRAFVEFVAERYTRPDARYGRACGYIIGNEVDSGWIWCNAGQKQVQDYVREYAIALRTAFYAVRSRYARARIYVSLDHLWTIPHQEYPLRFYRGRDIIDLLNDTFTREGNWDWSLAYHPYPENLFHANFWDDRTALDSFDTPRITFKNIDVLSRYMSQPHLLYDGRMRHIIFSEQGFHSDENEESERLQAAAYAYAYWKVERTPGIEAFILHAHVDNRDEFDLNLGLWRRDKSSPLANAPGSPKPIYEVFRDIDGPNRERVLASARQVVGPENWV